MKKILLIEDDEIFGSNTSKMLKSRGFDVKWYQSGDEAKDYILKPWADIILLDLELDGSEIHGEGLLEISKGNLKIPIIVMTGHSERIPEILEYEVYTILKKPFEISLLFHVINKALELHQIRRQIQKLQKKEKRSSFDYSSLVNLVLLIITFLIIYFKNSNSIFILALLVLVLIVQLIGGKNIKELIIKFKGLLFNIKTK